jgi:hypothetical protein
VPINSPKDGDVHGAVGVSQYSRSINGAPIDPKWRHIGFCPATASGILITAEGNTIAVGVQDIGAVSAPANANEFAPPSSEPADYHPPLPDNRWYTVIVGFEVGVFSSW